MPLQHRRSDCPISYCLDLVGDRWTMLVIRDMVMFGSKRFSEFQSSGEGIATNVLSDRLQCLAEGGILECSVDRDDGRKRIYRLTEKGIDLVPILIDLAQWGGRHDPNTAVPIEFRKRIENDREGVIAELRAQLESLGHG
ncbi:MAG: transcriptional regulator [Planctomycetota bacterium]|nr:MAG: transcriptional regulator [Planctomycetota bacterium]